MLSKSVRKHLRDVYDKLDNGNGIHPVESVTILRAAGLNVTAHEVQGSYRAIGSPMQMNFKKVVQIAERLYNNSVRGIVFLNALDAAARIFEENSYWVAQYGDYRLRRSIFENLAWDEEYCFPKELIPRITMNGEREDDLISLQSLMLDIMDETALDIFA